MWFFNRHKLVLILFTLAYLPHQGWSWQSEEMEMFDLVEEMNSTFYQYMDLPKDASILDIRRAYRKLSLQMHPDKNLEDKEADIKFRRLVAIYEILKDEKRRKEYDDILVNGLPDWRMPVFYYRKLRKMTLRESVALLFGLATIFHYAILWGIYLEKKLNMEDKLNTEYRKKKDQERKKNKSNGVDTVIAEKLGTIPTPRLTHDLLPISLTRGTYHTVRAIPAFFSEIAGLLKDHLAEKKKASEDLKQAEEDLQREKEDRETRKLEKKERKRKQVEENKTKHRDVTNEDPVIYQNINLDDLPSSPAKDNSKSKSSGWTDEEVCLLIKAVAKFPGGVPQRWEKIAEIVGRPVSHVTAKMKSLKDSGSLQSVISSTMQNKTGLSLAGNFVESHLRESELGQVSTAPVLFEVVENAMCGDSSDEDEGGRGARRRRKKGGDQKVAQNIQHEVEEEEAEEEIEGIEKIETYTSKAKLKAAKKSKSSKSRGNTEPSVSVNGTSLAPTVGLSQWSQVEQKSLEAAIRAFPKGTPERWDRIAEQLPSKTKADIIERAKSLSSLVRQKQSFDIPETSS